MLCIGRNLIEVRNVMSFFAELSILKSLLRRNDISQLLSEAHDHLDDALQCFNVRRCLRVLQIDLSVSDQFAGLVHLKNSQSEYEEARRKDAQLLESKIALYARNHQEALRGIEIQQQGMMDALIAMQRVSL